MTTNISAEERYAEEETFGPVIFEYSRAQALADRVLIDVTALAREAGFVVPVALTQAAYETCVAWTAEDSARQTHQDAQGRLWDVLSVLARRVCQAAPGVRELSFALYVIPRDGQSESPVRTPLKAVCGPGDHGEAVLTVMLPHED